MRLVSISFLSTFLSISFTIGFAPVLADTEIINFHFSTLNLETLPTCHLPSDFSGVLTVCPSTRVDLHVSESEPEQIVFLDLDESMSTSWTARISWPGSSPTRFSLDLYSSPLNESTNTSQLVLGITAAPLSPPFPKHRNQVDRKLLSTDFHLIVEPLIFGVIPQTALPAGLAIIIFVIGASLTVPYLIRFIEKTARGAMLERQVGGDSAQKLKHL